MPRLARILASLRSRNHHALAAAIALVALGLLSRQTPRISPQVGDALYAALLYAVLRALRTTWTPRTTAAAALGLALAVELSQALHTPTLDALRASVLGGALLGRGCSLADLLCAPIGVALAHGMARSWRKSGLASGRRRFALRLRAVLGRSAALLVLTTAVEVATFEPHAPARADAAVVLGAAVWHDRPSPVLRMRVDRAVALQRAGTVQALIFTGGRGDGSSQGGLRSWTRQLTPLAPEKGVTCQVPTPHRLRIRQRRRAQGLQREQVVSESAEASWGQGAATQEYQRYFKEPQRSPRGCIGVRSDRLIEVGALKGVNCGQHVLKGSLAAAERGTRGAEPHRGARLARNTQSPYRQAVAPIFEAESSTQFESLVVPASPHAAI